MTKMTEADAIKLHLAPPEKVQGVASFSGFSAALGDARAATKRDARGNKLPNGKYGSWIGALGYMALLDQIGSCFKPRNVITVKDNTIKKALGYFTTLEEAEKNALYSLRCAFAHDFSLCNIRDNKPELTHFFLVCEGSKGNVVTLPKVQWDGDFKNVASDNVTIVDLELFGDLVENICSQIRMLAQKNDLEITLAGGSDELIRRYSFVAK